MVEYISLRARTRRSRALHGSIFASRVSRDSLEGRVNSSLARSNHASRGVDVRRGVNETVHRHVIDVRARVIARHDSRERFSGARGDGDGDGGFHREAHARKQFGARTNADDVFDPRRERTVE